MEQLKKQGAASPVPEAEFHTWKFPGSPKRIHLSLDVVERLQREISEAARNPGFPGVEVGGLLLGSTASSKAGVEITDYQPLACETRPDGRFALTAPADLERLDEALSATRDGLVVVGYYRSHLRDGLCLDDRDLTVCQIWFPDPAQVFLVVKPEADGSVNAGFFFWDQDKIHSAFSFLEFPFHAELLRSMNAMEGSRELAALEAAALEAAPRLAEPPPDRPSRWKSVLVSVLLAGFVGLAIMLGVRFDLFRKAANWGNDGTPADPAFSLGLQVVTRGSDLMVSWNRNSPALRAAQSGVLVIRDGSMEPQEIPLDASQLRSGSVLYAPSYDRIQFRLEVGETQKVSELVLALIKGRAAPDESQVRAADAGSPMARQPGASPPAQNVPRAAVPVQPPPATAPSQTGVAGGENRTGTVAARTVRTFVPPPADRPAEQPSRTIYVDPPTLSNTQSMPISPPVATLPATRVPDPPPPATPAPVPSPAAKETVPAAQNQPAARETAPPVQTRPAPVQPTRGEEPKPASLVYTQPRPLRQTAPSVSMQLLRALVTRDTQVEVRVSVDEAGKVTRAEVISANFHRLLTTAVIDAARKWTFEPARMGGKPVPGEAKIVFLFRAPTGGQAP